MQKTKTIGIRMSGKQLDWLLKERSQRDCSAGKIIRGFINSQMYIDDFQAEIKRGETNPQT